MIEDFEDFCLYVYMIVDDKCQQLAHLLKRSGLKPKCSDSELIAMTLISEAKGWNINILIKSFA